MSALGSLVVKLGLDYAQYTGGLDKSEQAALAASKKIQDTFDGLKNKVAATAGAVAGGLAAGFTIAAAKSIISGSIEIGAALDDLRMQTGSTVEALSGLMAVGKFNNMGPEQIGGAMNKLAANLAGATEESKGTGKALEALGIDFETFKKLRPEEQMQTVAKAMAKFEDGTGKSAIAMALYSKQGAQMLPFLHDLAEVGDLQAKITTEQAAAAANLDDNLTRLSTSGEAWKKELANGMIPALDLGAQALVDMMSGSGGLREEVRRLVADGSIKQWTTDAIKGLSYVADVGQIAWRVLQSIGKGMGGLAAALVQALSGDFRSAWATLQASGQDMIDVFDGPTIGARFRDSLDKVAAAAAATGDAAGKARPSLDGFANTTDKAGKAATEAKDPFDALRESVVKATAVYQAEATAGEKLTEGHKKAVEVLDQIRTGKVKVTEAQAIQIEQDIKAMLAAEEENEQRKEFIKTADAERAARLKITEAVEQSAATLVEQNNTLREEIELIGLNDAAQLRVLQRRNEAIILTKEATLAEMERASAITGTMTREEVALKAEIEALRERNQLLGAKYDKTVVAKAAEEARTEWTKFTDSIYNGLSDSLYRGFEAGKGFFKSFWDGIKNTAKTTVLKFGVQGIMTGVSGFLGLGSSAASAATGGTGGAASTISTGLSLANMFGAGGLGGSMAAGAGWLTGATTLGGSLSAGMSLLGTGTMAGGMSGLGMIAGALGPIALGVGAVLALVKGLDDSGTIHTGALSQYSAAGGLASSTTHGAFGMGFGGVDYSADAEKFTGAMAQSIVQMLDSTATTFGQQAGYKAATAFADDTSKDGAWGGLLITKLEETIVNWDTARTSRWAPKEFADGAPGREQYLAAVAADVRAALDSIGLPDWASGMLDKLGKGASLEQIAAVVDQVNAAKATFASFAQYMPSFANAADSALSKLVEASGGVQALAGNMATFVDRFYTEGEKLAVNTDNVRAAMARLGFEMPTTREGFKALVQAQIALGDAGAKGLAGLLAIAGAVDSIMATSVDAAQTAADLETRQTEQRDKAFRALERAVSAEQKQLQARLDTARETASIAGDVVSALHDAVRELRGEVEGARMGQASAGRDFIVQALATAKATGYLPDSQKLAEAISDVRAGLDASNFANTEERNYAALVLAGQLAGLEEVAGLQLTDAQRTVRELEGQSRQLDQTLDYWRQQIEIGNGTYEGIMSVVAAVEGMRNAMFQSATTKPGSPTGSGSGGGVSGPGYRDRGTVARADYGADVALSSFDLFEAWYQGLATNAPVDKLQSASYQVPDWMRMSGMLGTGSAENMFGTYLYFKNNPQFAKDFEQIMTTGRSSLPTDGSTLVRSDLSKMPTDAAEFFKNDRNSLLSYESFGLDPVLAYKLYKDGPEQFGLDIKRENFTEWLRTHKWTEGGIVESNNTLDTAKPYAGYKLPRWDTASGNVVDLDGRIYTPEGKFLGTASREMMTNIYGAAFVGTTGGSYGDATRSALYGSQVQGGATEADYYNAIRTGLDAAINSGKTAQDIADAIGSTGASMHDVAMAYGISVAELEANLRAGGATNIPRFARGGNHLGGLRIVGERGWEVEATGPSRIWNQQQLAQALTGGGGGTALLESLMRELIAGVGALRAPTALIAANTGTAAGVLTAVKRGDSLALAAAPEF